MNIIVYQKKFAPSNFSDEFLDNYFSAQMKYLASDLLDKGLSPGDITIAIQEAISCGQTAGLNIRQHFYPLYTYRKGSLVKDCKLSELGYGLVLLNANVKFPIVANWQIKLVEHVLR